MKNIITDQSNHRCEGLQNKGNNAAGIADIVTLMQEVEEIRGEAEMNHTNLGPPVNLHFKKLVAVSKHLLDMFKFNCVCVAMNKQ